jgi:hypothetical protein
VAVGFGKALLHAAAAGSLILVVAQAGFAQPPAQGKQPQWKEGEYAVYEPAQKETQPLKKLELLTAWKEKFPSSEYEDLRKQMFLQTYSQILQSAYSTQDPTQLDADTKVARDVLANLDALFANKPEKVSDADWATVKKQIQLLAQNVPGYAAWQRKDLPTAEEEFTKSLQAEPNQPQVSLWLWSIVASQRKPEKYSFALYEYARASAYDGPGALDAAIRQKAKTDFESIYTKFHGSNEGMSGVEDQAKAAALPPPGFKILSKSEVATAQAEAEAKKQDELRKANPMLALWQNIKTALTGADGENYFNSSMKGAALPGGVEGVTEFKGKLIEATPAVRPKQLKLAIADGATPDVILNLDAPLAGKMEPGAEIGFQGVASSYTATPFLVTFDVEKAKISGWKGAPAARPPVRRTRPRSGD